MKNTRVVEVFKSVHGGGNPAPIVLDADGLEPEAMRAIAQRFGHESGFVMAPEHAADSDYRLRFFVPRHEMSMCGHATIGAVWLLHTLGRLEPGELTIETLSGPVKAYIRDAESRSPFIEISQPRGVVTRLDQPGLREEVAAAIGLTPEDLADLPLLNAATSRVKTLIPLTSPERLDAARPDSARIEALCDVIGSTGLYPFCPHPGMPRRFDSRQFPKGSGYPEDAATGIAATALTFGLLEYGLIPADATPVLIHQGRAMGRPSDIHVRLDLSQGGTLNGCFVGGYTAFADQQAPHGEHDA